MHPCDRLILRDLFWFLVLPYQFGVWKRAQERR